MDSEEQDFNEEIEDIPKKNLKKRKEQIVKIQVIHII